MNSVSRRAFLAASAAVTAGSAANSAVTVGVLGTGNRGTFVAAMLAKSTPGRIVALCDLYDDKIRAAKASIGIDNPRTYRVPIKI